MRLALGAAPITAGDGSVRNTLYGLPGRHREALVPAHVIGSG